MTWYKLMSTKKTLKLAHILSAWRMALNYISLSTRIFGWRPKSLEMGTVTTKEMQQLSVFSFSLFIFSLEEERVLYFCKFIHHPNFIFRCLQLLLLSVICYYPRNTKSCILPFFIRFLTEPWIRISVGGMTQVVSLPSLKRGPDLLKNNFCCC